MKHRPCRCDKPKQNVSRGRATQNFTTLSEILSSFVNRGSALRHLTVRRGGISFLKQHATEVLLKLARVMRKDIIHRVYPQNVLSTALSRQMCESLFFSSSGSNGR